MLAELTIKNFAIIEHLTLAFEKGLTVFTGETGAGKSIIIDAIQLLAGGRGSSEFVRYGEKKAEIEGVFFVDENHSVISLLEEYDIDPNEGTIVIQRDITSNGKSICRINHKHVTLTVLKAVGSKLIDIHGQHEHQSLMQKENHRILLDDFGKNTIHPVLEEYKTLFQTFHELKRKQKKLIENEQELAQRLDLLQYQLKEIEEANLLVNEDVELEEEKTKLANYEKLYDSLGSAYEALSQENGGLYWVAEAMKQLEQIHALDKELNALFEAISNCYYVLEDAMFQIKDKWDKLEFDPNRLNSIESRLNQISMLKRKYGATIQEILDYSEKIKSELESLINREEHLSHLNEEIQKN